MPSTKKPRWIVRCGQLAAASYSEKLAADSAEAMRLYLNANDIALRKDGGIICVTDCESGREKRYMVRRWVASKKLR